MGSGVPFAEEKMRIKENKRRELDDNEKIRTGAWRELTEKERSMNRYPSLIKGERHWSSKCERLLLAS